MKKRDVSLSCVALLWLIAFALACRLGASHSVAGVTYDDFSSRLLGASRAAFSQHFFQQADTFFHMGSVASPPKAMTNIIVRWAEEVRPETHAHLSKANLKEIMPWLRLATQMDPHNIDAYVVAAYWMERTGHPDLADEIIEESIVRNPNDYRVHETKGQIAFRRGAIGRAAQSLDAALRLAALEPDPQEIRFDLSRMLSYRGALHEVAGEVDRAIAMYRYIARLMPENTAMERRIAKLERGEDVLTLSSASIQTMFRNQGASHMLDFSAEESDDGHVHGPHCGHEHAAHDEEHIHGPDCDHGDDAHDEEAHGDHDHDH